MISLELLYYRMRDIMLTLEQELDDSQQALYYAEPGDNIVHLTYVVERIREAVETARVAHLALQWLAYETGVIDALPALA